ncbi:putative protein kinase [Cedratvirus kamchatka]|uniref:Protein kinase domain-containing protein n=1 Tax=Cedratvirus kamchatka TaxID=2716914 RepID=A0A6G8MYX0_9VIRU|nr:putative protein kinase [Cedratvirus kamchatka]WIL04066.1 putative protein kinase [Cedratvirus lena]WIL04684.1 putative protein kinase [Cedratvirus duvanny]
MSYQKQLKKMVKQVCKDIDEKDLWTLYSQEGYKEITKRIKPCDLMEEPYLSYLPACHTSRDKKLYLEKPFSSGKHVRLLRVKKEPLVVKWYQSGERNASYEIEVYLKLKSLGCPIPYFSCSYEFWGHPVLVMEKLEKLGKREDVYKLGRQVLEQLRYLHSFAIHCDIKPDNIMKKISNSSSSEYYLIDYGGVSQEKLEYGYRRWIWSKYWTSQEPHKKKQIATGRHDFKELAYTMNYLKNRGDINYRKDFKGRLKTFMERVKKVDKTKIRSRDYEDLIKILS